MNGAIENKKMIHLYKSSGYKTVKANPQRIYIKNKPPMSATNDDKRLLFLNFSFQNTLIENNKANNIPTNPKTAFKQEKSI